jgi:LuxR family maltose regulon positive regulatory protein
LTVSFLTRTAILERLSGPLCDVTVGAALGAGVDRLDRSNLLLIPLDRRGRFRYHHLFQPPRRAGPREPDMLPELHTRAASWYELIGQP